MFYSQNNDLTVYSFITTILLSDTLYKKWHFVNNS